MKNYHQDYFYMQATGDNTPLLSFDKNQITDTHLLFARRPLDENYVVSFKLGYPVPKNPEMGDLLEKAQHPVISEKLKTLLKEMHLKDVQFLPAEIRNPNNGDIHTNYWVLHIHNLIYCMNREASVYRMSNDQVASIERLVFDHEVLDKVPLEERLVFALGEQRLYMFFHRSVVEQIIALQPVNVSFICRATREEVIDPLPEALLPYITFVVRKEEEEEEEFDIKEILRRNRLALGIIKEEDNVDNAVPALPKQEDDISEI